MKQKIIIRVRMDCEKCRRKAMKIASVAKGVNSIVLEGEEKDRLVITGDGVDSVCLTKHLRKKLCQHATILSVGEVKENKTEKSSKPTDSSSVIYYVPLLPPCPMYCPELCDECSNPTICSIL